MREPMKGVEHMTCTSFFLQLTFHFLIILQTKNSFNLFHFLRFRRQFGVASYRTIQTKLCAVTTVENSQELDQSNKLQNTRKQYYKQTETVLRVVENSRKQQSFLSYLQQGNHVDRTPTAIWNICL